MSTRLVFFVEGYTDEIFVEQILLKHIRTDFIPQFYQYSSKTNVQIRRFLKTILNRIDQDFNLLFFTDMDLDHYEYGQHPTVSDRIEEFIESKGLSVFPENLLDQFRDRANVVVCEIESWFNAGMDADFFAEVGIRANFGTTDNVCKEEFWELFETRDKDPILARIIANYILEDAVKNNDSLDTAILKIRSLGFMN